MGDRCQNTACDVKPAPYHNYCSWECGIAIARANGAKEHLPNGLPIRCITASGWLLEMAGGDHPDYKCPVEVEFIGTREEPDDDRDRELHALLYTDGSVVVTFYGCCYAMWYARSGEFAGGSLWKKGEWKLSAEAIRTIDQRGPRTSPSGSPT